MKPYCRIAIILLAFIYLSMGALAAENTEQSILKEHANEFWDSLVKGNNETLFKFLPDEEKEKLAKKTGAEPSIKQDQNIRYTAYRIDGVEVYGDQGWVKVHQSVELVRYSGIPAYEVDVVQLWKKGRSNWYPLPQEQWASVPNLPPSVRSKEDEEELARLANELWEASEKMKWDVVYNFCEPGFKEKVSKEEFSKTKPMNIYISHKIDWTEVSGNKGRVRVIFESKVNDPSLTKLESQRRAVIEEWIKVDGRWYKKVQEQGPKGKQ